ncbi:hypothetical protein [Massilia sp. TWR1-2-2]|uniref:hypothetical protein n=1 Tax=Massilia sp. TWR1-2-2 TaxID=2804584 RepID=UPI003CEDCF06
MTTLRLLLENSTVSDIKQLLAHFPNVDKVGRKEILIATLSQQLSGDGLLRIWEQLDPCQRLAVGEATHEPRGMFDGERFAAKYGQEPSFEHPPEAHRSRGAQTALMLLMHRFGEHLIIPSDLRVRLKAFVPVPAPNTLQSVAILPAADADGTPMTMRSTAPDALHDVVVMLRAIDQKLIAVSDKTRLPGVAALGFVLDKIAGGDFYGIVAPRDEWEQSIGPIKAMAWPLLMQAGGLAQPTGTKLGLTATGVKALHAAPADVLRDIWRTWLTSTLFDEFSRVDEIKGQKGKGRMSATAPRRAIVGAALRGCPVDTWIGVDEWSRHMRAEGIPLAISDDIWNLYVCDPNYGSLAYAGAHSWNVLQLRYLLCVLFEYCATLGMIDVAYRTPHDARGFGDLWGTEDMTFLSRYDGLMYFRLNPLGAYCLGASASYTPIAAAASCTLAVQASLQVKVTQGALSADERLMLDNWAVEQDPLHWRLDREKAVAAIERGHDVAQLAAFLQAHDGQPLPALVEAFMRACDKRGKAMKVLAPSLLIECVDADTADLLAAHKDTARLCLRAGQRHLVVRLDQEAKFRKAARGLGYGILA